MKFLISGLLLLLTNFGLFAQMPRIEDTTFIFNVLIDSPDEDVVKETCGYYGFNETGTEDGYLIFQDGTGSVLKCKMNSLTPKMKVPFIELQTSDTKKELENVLKRLGYMKEGDRYMKGSPYTRTRTVCYIEPLSDNKKSKEYNLICTKELNK